MKKNNIDWSVDVDCYDETQGKRLFNKVTKIAPYYLNTFQIFVQF